MDEFLHFSQFIRVSIARARISFLFLRNLRSIAEGFRGNILFHYFFLFVFVFCSLFNV